MEQKQWFKRDGKMYLIYGYILKVEPTEFATGLKWESNWVKSNSQNHLIFV